MLTIKDHKIMTLKQQTMTNNDYNNDLVIPYYVAHTLRGRVDFRQSNSVSWFVTWTEHGCLTATWTSSRQTKFQLQFSRMPYDTMHFMCFNLQTYFLGFLKIRHIPTKVKESKNFTSAKLCCCNLGQCKTPSDLLGNSSSSSLLETFCNKL